MLLEEVVGIGGRRGSDAGRKIAGVWYTFGNVEGGLYIICASETEGEGVKEDAGGTRWRARCRRAVDALRCCCSAAWRVFVARDVGCREERRRERIAQAMHSIA